MRPIVDLGKPTQYGPRGLEGAGRGFLRERGMDDDARERGENRSDEAALAARLSRLGKRLGDERATRPPQQDVRRTDSSALGQGLRLSSELVAGVLVGGVLGWSLDHFVGTKPFGFIVLLLLGFVAGLVNMMRSAGMMAKSGWRLRK
jgi:ATP synthase protein I